MHRNLENTQSNGPSRHLVSTLVAVFSVLSTIAYSSEQNSTVIGRESLVNDCYHRSQQATITRSATRNDVDVCNRAIADGAILKAELAASYSNRGVLHMAMENYSQAYRDYDRALKLDEDLAEAYINRGNLWFAVQQYERAIDDYARALELGTKQEAVAFLNRGLAYENNGDLQNAKQDYVSSLQVKPDWQSAMDKLKRVEQKLNTPDE